MEVTGMIRTDDLDRVLQQWFEGDAPGPEPRVLLATVIDTTRRHRPRPGWLVRARGGGVSARPVRMPSTWSRLRPLRLALLLGLLVALAAAAAVLVGTRPSPAPVGISNGWIAFAASPITAGLYGGDGEHRDIYVTREGTTARRIIGAEGDGRSQGCPRFSPDGSRLAYTEGDETVGKIDLLGRTPVTNRSVVVVALGADGEPSPPVLRVSLPTSPGPLPCPEWSPDGSNLAFFTGAEVWVADVGSRAMRTLPVEPTRSDDPRYPEWRFLDLEWAPDASSIAVGESGRIRLIPTDGTEPTVLPVHAVTAYSMGWLAGGRQIAYLDGPWGPSTVRIVELDGGGDRVSLTDVESFVLSPDGSRLAYEVGDGPGAVMDIDGSNATSLPDLGSGLLWSPDGRRLLSRTYWSSADMPSELVTFAVIPGSTPTITPYPDVSFEWMPISHVSWQAVHQ
jgi:Tol biopolymer transport system component